MGPMALGRPGERSPGGPSAGPDRGQGDDGAEPHVGRGVLEGLDESGHRLGAEVPERDGRLVSRPYGAAAHVGSPLLVRIGSTSASRGRRERSAAIHTPPGYSQRSRISHYLLVMFEAHSE